MNLSIANSFRWSSIVLTTVLGILPTIAVPGFGDDATPRPAEAYAKWKYHGSVFILTTPQQVDIPAGASLEQFPLLVRLHRDFFDFRQAKSGGEDIRFSTSMGQPMAFQIDEWNPGQGVASIWVRVPVITGNARQEIKLHWGNADAASESNGKAVFNESNGYISVWHMNETALDEVGTLKSLDTGTAATAGMIGGARHLPGQKGIFGGDKISNYPSGASSHSTEAWFRAEKPNATILGWGNEGGGRGSKVRMLFRSPPHIHIDSDFSDVKGRTSLPMREWIHVVHTYDREDGRIYINGKLDTAAKPMLSIKSPARLWIGGWYNNYDFVGDMDEVRISQVARSAEWIRLQYENQKPFQTLVGPLVLPGRDFTISPSRVIVEEGKSATVSVTAGGAQKICWILKQDDLESVVATDRLSYTLDAGRVTGDRRLTLYCKAVYPEGVQVNEVAITIKEAIPEPVFALNAPAAWDGRRSIEVVPQVTNLTQMQTQEAGQLNYTWSVDGIAATRQIQPGKLVLTRGHNSGTMKVTAAIDNGGEKTVKTVSISVVEPHVGLDPWVFRTPPKEEKPEDNQFIARDDGQNGTLFCAGTLADAADSVFVRVFADDKPYHTETGGMTAGNSYSLAVKLKAGLVKYRIEFGSRTGDRETVLHTAANIICGDVYLINGQSNADATDVGKDDPVLTSDWIRSFGSPSGHPEGGRLARWGNAVVRDRQGGKFQVGYWGMELAMRLVERQKIPICLLNGAVGGSRIDQHQRNPADPTDVATIYGRLLWRVQQARLAHGVRGVLWHQGENDQGADGPSGGFGWQTYRQYFIDLATAWKEDYPNIQHYYVFQIWPKACAMGIDGSDNKLRDIQRTLSRYFSNLTVMSTLGIKPPGGCHYPIEGYAEFARLIGPVLENRQYQYPSVIPVTPPDLQRAFFTSGLRDELVLEFDQEIVWIDALANQFYLNGKPLQMESGSAAGNRLTLKLNGASKANHVTYLDSATWNPGNLLYGKNGLAALTFCDVSIEAGP